MKMKSPRSKISSDTMSTKDIESSMEPDPRLIPQKRLLTKFLWDKSIPSIPTQEERVAYPFRHTGFISELFFWWVTPLLKVGYRRTLDADDLFKVNKGTDLDVDVQAIKFNRIFQKRREFFEAKYFKKHNIDPTPENYQRFIVNNENGDFRYPESLVLWSLFYTFRVEYLTSIFYKCVGDISIGLNPLLVRALIKYVSKKAAGLPLSNDAAGYGYAIGISALVMISGFGFAHFFHDSAFTGCEVKGVLTKILLDESFKLDRKSRIDYPPSAITSLMGTDLSKIDLATSFFPALLTLPIGIAITIALLAVNLGGAVQAGVAFFLVLTVVIVYVTKPLMRLRKGANIFTDSRVKYVKELLNSMKIIKYYSWEPPYLALISKIRNQEMSVMLKIQFLRNCVAALATALPSLSSMVGFLAMYGKDKSFLNSPANVFSSLALFNILSSHVALLPLALSSSTDAYIACKRVQEYLLAPKEQPDPEYHKLPFDENSSAIEVINGEFEWDQVIENEEDLQRGQDARYESNESKENEREDLSEDDDSLTTQSLSNFTGLRSINLNVKHGEFIVITGSIGSGKSSLLSALSGTMPRLSGLVNISGNLLLCSNPWIQNTTVRENIIFGKTSNDELYKVVVKCCALESDFEILPAGDQTEIGERGVNLSGGQKARINLARAVYSTLSSSLNNIILLDDVLSAVDAKVGKQIMDQCIMGLLNEKTRILATHQLSLIGTADRIIFLNGDGTIDIGTQEELISRNKLFANLMEFQQEGEKTEQEEGKINSELSQEKNVADDDENDPELILIKKETTKREYEKDRGKLIQVEIRQTNAIPTKMILAYLKSGCGSFGFPLMMLLFLCSLVFTAFTMLFQNVWLSFWTTNKFPNRSDGFYIGIYVMITLVFSFCATWQFCSIAYISTNSSTNLNLQALGKILHAPMSYFDTTPMGRILNRFTKDTDVLDNEIQEQARTMFLGFSSMIGIYIMSIIYMPYFAICVPFIVAYSVCVFSFYQASSREVKRIEAIQRSIVYSNFEEVLQGLETIKLYSNDQLFIDRNTNFINRMNEPYFLADSLQRWMAVSLHLCAAAINLIISLLCVAQVFDISASSAGLIISYLVQIAMQLTTSARSMGQLEQHISSVERICEYALDLPQEAAYDTLISPPDSWPSQGGISFQNVSMKYRPNLPYVLTNLCIEVKPMEKIGICGRTGAGKSTIMTALYRLCEFEGVIEIDGVDISGLGLHDLRTKLSIIPQDPVLFRGTIRLNLDPFGQLSDEALYDALVRSGCITREELPTVLKQTKGSVKEDGSVTTLHKFHLDNIVDDNGNNFSLGQRQILSLARAIVKNSKILILDEATSSVDYETDAKIQQTIVQEFSGCTILCIAHRLKTIINYDRILVLDKGCVEEFATPWELFNNDKGIFRSMCDKSGIVADDFEKRL